MAESVLLWTGDVVEEGVGPVRCGRTTESGRLCGGLLGWPPVGAQLVDVVEPDVRLGACEPGIAALRCQDCGAASIFAVGVARVEASG